MDVGPLLRAGGPDLRGTRRELHVLARALPAVPASTALARVTARVACRAWRVPHVADDGVLLASELVTAAVRATAGVRVVLRVLMTPRRLRIEAHDASGRLAAAVDDDGRLPTDRVLTHRELIDRESTDRAWGDYVSRDRVPDDRVPTARAPFDRAPPHQLPTARVPLDRVHVDRVHVDRVHVDRVAFDPVPADQPRPDRVPLEQVQMDRVQQEVVRALTCRCGVGPSGPGSQAWGELALEVEPQTR